MIAVLRRKSHKEVGECIMRLLQEKQHIGLTDIVSDCRVYRSQAKTVALSLVRKGVIRIAQSGGFILNKDIEVVSHE